MKFLSFFLTCLLAGSCPLLAMNKRNNEHLGQQKKLHTKKIREQSVTQQFLESVKNDDQIYLRNVMQRGVDVNCKDALGRSALVIAAQNGSLGILQVLMQNNIHFTYDDYLKLVNN